MNNGYWEESPRDLLSYRAAIKWLLWNDRLLWLEKGQPSQAAIIIASLFDKSEEVLRYDIKTAKAEQTNPTSREKA